MPWWHDAQVLDPSDPSLIKGVKVGCAKPPGCASMVLLRLWGRKRGTRERLGAARWRAGEDVIRSSGVPFAIVRPVALTEEPAGAELQLDQGDTIRGKISRWVGGWGGFHTVVAVWGLCGGGLWEGAGGASGSVMVPSCADAWGRPVSGLPTCSPAMQSAVHPVSGCI